MQVICANCKFWSLRDRIDDEASTCRRNAPPWPAVLEDDFCGQFQTSERAYLADLAEQLKRQEIELQRKAGDAVGPDDPDVREMFKKLRAELGAPA